MKKNKFKLYFFLENVYNFVVKIKNGEKMKQILKEYNKTVIELLKDKKYIIIFLIVTLLSFGFAITHTSVGPDDLCFDRYFKDTYILSQGRWVTFLLYNILQITSFSPFWIELLTTIVLFFTAIIICAFIKKQYGNKVNSIIYLLFSCLFISFPILKEFFIYEIPNFAIALSNLLIVIITIINYENNYNIKSKKIFFILGILTTLSISTYESCIQTFFVMIFFQGLMKTKYEDESIKNSIIYILHSIIMLAIGVVLYKVIWEIIIIVLKNTGTLQKDYALHSTIFEMIVKLRNNPTELNIFLENWLKNVIMIAFNYKKNYITIFLLIELSALIFSIIKNKGNKRFNTFLLVLGLILSNYIFTIIMKICTLRVNYSWAISVGLLAVYIFILFENKRYISNIILIIFILIILWNSRTINNAFYQEYLGYEKDKSDAYAVAREIYLQCEDITKPICYTLHGRRIYETEKYIEGRNSIFKWGLISFEGEQEKQKELTKFINSLGYNFSYLDNDEYNEALEEYIKVRDTLEPEQWVTELDKYIIVNLKFIE